MTDDLTTKDASLPERVGPAGAGTSQRPGAQHRGPTFITRDKVVLGLGAGAVIASGALHYAGAPPLVTFIVSAIAVAMLASLVGTCVEQIGDRFGPGATGVLQSALGNLPELFIALFALKEGPHMVPVVQAALAGSILANLLLVMGAAFVVGGLKHGRQKLNSERSRMSAVLMTLSVGAMLLPSITAHIHTPAAKHESGLSIFVSVVLILVFVASLPASLRKGASPMSESAHGREKAEARWPIGLAVGLLAIAGVLAAFVSDWFVQALTPAMEAVGIHPIFAGLVIVAIAGNAIENVVGLQLAAKNDSETAFSVMINSPLQIALVLAPALVILSHVFGLATLTLVFSPLLIVALVIAVLVAVVVTMDGESNWLEGVALIGLYCCIAASFWWG